MKKRQRSKHKAKPGGGGSDWLLVLAFFVSGFAALGYELIWTRLLGLTLGGETHAVIGILSGFFGGLALGAWCLDKRISGSASPGRWFVILELVVAAWAMVVTWLLLKLPGLAGELLGQMEATGLPKGLLAGSLAAMVMLPATFCMGASLPAVIAIRRRYLPTDGATYGIGRLYAANMLGAASGIFATVHWLMPAAGFLLGTVVLVGLNLAAAGLAWQWTRRRGAQREDLPSVGKASGQLGAVLLLGLTGCCALALEVLVVRTLSQVFRNTVYTFADVLAVFIVGNAIGVAGYAWATRRWSLLERRWRLTLGWLLIGSALTAFAVALAMPVVPEWFLLEDGGFVEVASREAATALCLLLPSTVLMGALFTHLFGRLGAFGYGRAYAVNTIGGALAPMLATTVLVPWLGLGGALLVVGGGYLIPGLCLLGESRPIAALIAAGAAIGMAAIVPMDLDLTKTSADRQVIHRELSAYGVVTVSEFGEGEGQLPRELRVNRHFAMGGGLSFAEQRMGTLSLLLAPEAKSAVFLGVGTGATMGAVADFSEVSAVGVEMVPEILAALPYFSKVNRDLSDLPGVELVSADARHYLTSRSLAADLIVGELFHPARDGAAFLYSYEHFQTVREDLAEGGRFVQWLPAYQLSPEVMRSIVRTYLEVFPEAEAILGIYNVKMPIVGLVGGKNAGAIMPLSNLVDGKLEEPNIQRLVDGRRDLAAAYVADATALGKFAAGAPVNTDTHPFVLFEAPKSLGHRSESLESLLVWRNPPAATSRGEAWLGSAESRYWEAAGAYLVGDSARARQGLASQAAVDGFVAALVADPTFRPAMGMLTAAINRQPGLGANAFEQLLAAHPKHPPFYGAYLRYLRQVGNRQRFDEIKAQAQRHMLRETNPVALETQDLKQKPRKQALPLKLTPKLRD